MAHTLQRLDLDNQQLSLNIDNELTISKGNTLQLPLVTSIADLQFFPNNIALFDGSTWEKKTGDVQSNGGGFPGTLIRVNSTTYWERKYNNYINSKWFGAGITVDIGLVINNIINSLPGGIIVIPSGVHLVYTTIVLKRGFILKGEKTIDDLNASTLKLADNQNKSILVVDAAISNINTHYMGLENLLFDGNYINQTIESEMVIFGGYIGTYIRYCFFKNAYGVALSGKYGLDLEISHVWILNTVTSTYAFDTNNHLAENERDGLLNISHLFVENTRNSKVGDGYTLESVRQNAIRFQKLVNLNVNHVHIEVAKNAISLSKNRDVNFTSISSAHIGNSTIIDVAIVSILDGITDIIRIGNCITYNSTSNIAMIRKISGLTSNYIPDNLNSENMSNYVAHNDFDIGTINLPYSAFANKIDIQKLGGTSEGKLSLLETSGNGTYLKQQGSAFKIGSNVSQIGDKDYITINSFGNAGDNITVNTPIYLGERTSGGNLSKGSILTFNTNPAFSFGSNRVLLFPTVSSSGTSASNTPDYIGQLHINTSLNQLSFSKGTTSNSDWISVGDVTTNTTQTITGVKTFVNNGGSGIRIDGGNIAGNNRLFMGGAGLEIQTNDGSGSVGILSLYSSANERFKFLQSGEFLIGTPTSVPSSTLTINSTTRGVLFPRMTTTQKNAITSPANGLVIFDTTLNKLCVFTTVWETITSV